MEVGRASALSGGVEKEAGQEGMNIDAKQMKSVFICETPTHDIKQTEEV